LSIAITDEHVALAEAVRRFLDHHCPPAVARAALEADEEQLPPFWADLANLGWLGLHVPDQHGGQGFGLSELAIVLEEAGRAGAPGPLLPTVLASALIAIGGGEQLRDEVLPGLAAGTSLGAVAFPATSALDAVAGPDRSVVLSGTARPVLGAALADWLVVAAKAPEGETWCVVPAGELSVSVLPSLDPARRVAAVSAGDVAVPAGRQLPLGRRQIDDVIAVLVAAECAGGAAWCLDTATAYAKVREQFGRPIGQFQAVKHRCADMLVAVEQARAVVWDAARALDQAAGAGDHGPEAATAYRGTSLAAAIAATIATEAFARVAKDCIQVLGGIGFTWEHDAHRYLRRAISSRQLMGGTPAWRAQAAQLAAAGARRRLDVDLPAGSEGQRAELRREVDAIAAAPPEQQRALLVDAGLFVPHWPPPWGRASGPVEQLLIDQELSRARLRRPNLAVGAWAAPTIAAHGDPGQQQRWVRPTLTGSIRWCQLFSEPGAGSDLASLTTKAVRADGGWSISGQKVWTSMAVDADWGICLARTDPAAPKHAGITYFVVDMQSEGIEVRPLKEMTGHAMFNEVFLSDVFVPDDCVIGLVNGGWTLARTTLANERVAMGRGSSFGGGVEALLSLIESQPATAADHVTRDTVGALVAEAQTVALLGHRSTHRAVAGAGPGPEASVRKLLSAEHDQRVQEFGLGLLGAEGATTEGPAGQWSFGFLANRCLTIAGGTSEVQRNVIAERLLGLPRDPDPGR
jgi:alkylation response protein AidB-like acyl-CoA dehydrogenase